MKHTNLHQVNWSWDVMMKGSLNNWRLLIAVMTGVLLSCSVLAGTVVFYSALEGLALKKAIEDLPQEQVDVLIQADISPSGVSEYLKLKNSVYEGHGDLTEEYLEEVVEGGKSATFFLTEPGYEHTAGKNDFRSFGISFSDIFFRISQLILSYCANSPLYLLYFPNSMILKFL